MLLLFLLTGCVTSQTVLYDIGLEQVDRPADAATRYGEYVITKSDTANVSKYIFEDSLIRIAWLPRPKTFAFELENRTDHSIKIIWDDAALVDTDGRSHRIMHAGVKYTERNNPQAATVVARHARITDLIQSTSHVEYISGIGWTSDAVIQPYTSTDLTVLQAATNNIGKSLSVLLPIEIQGVTNEYVFMFKVFGAEVPSGPAPRQTYR